MLWRLLEEYYKRKELSAHLIDDFSEVDFNTAILEIGIAGRVVNKF